MRRVAALYDIHGNLPALEAALAEVRAADVEAIVVGGDVVPGPMARECLDLLLALDLPVRFVRGNCESAVLAEIDGTERARAPEPVRGAMQWTAARLDEASERALRAWPSTIELDVDGVGRVLFCHATPRSETEIFTRRTPEQALLPVFAGLPADLVVCGHSHMQFDRTVGRLRVVNAGSVGMPFDVPGASWLLLGPAVELRRTSYDLEAAATLIRHSEYPDAAAFADRHVLSAPGEEATLAAYAHAELK